MNSPKNQSQLGQSNESQLEPIVDGLAGNKPDVCSIAVDVEPIVDGLDGKSDRIRHPLRPNASR